MLLRSPNGGPLTATQVNLIIEAETFAANDPTVEDLGESAAGKAARRAYDIGALCFCYGDPHPHATLTK